MALNPLPRTSEFEGPGGRRLVKKMCKPKFSPYPTMLSTIDGNCRHLHHINILRLHTYTNTSYSYGLRMGLHAPNFQQTCPRYNFSVNKISEYKHNV